MAAALPMEELGMETMEEGGLYDKRRRYRRGKRGRGRATGVAGIVEKAEDEPDHHYADEFAGDEDDDVDAQDGIQLTQTPEKPGRLAKSKGDVGPHAHEEEADVHRPTGNSASMIDEEMDELAEEGGLYDRRRYRRRRARRDDGPMLESEEAELTELEFVHDAVVGGDAAGDDDAEYRPTRGEHFGHGREALSEAGKKGAEIATKMRTEEQRKEAARKAARTRAERYGQQLHVSDPSQDELQGIDTKVYRNE